MPFRIRRVCTIVGGDVCLPGDEGIAAANVGEVGFERSSTGGGGEGSLGEVGTFEAIGAVDIWRLPNISFCYTLLGYPTASPAFKLRLLLKSRDVRMLLVDW